MCSHIYLQHVQSIVQVFQVGGQRLERWVGHLGPQVRHPRHADAAVGCLKLSAHDH